MLLEPNSKGKLSVFLLCFTSTGYLYRVLFVFSSAVTSFLYYEKDIILLLIHNMLLAFFSLSFLVSVLPYIKLVSRHVGYKLTG